MDLKCPKCNGTKIIYVADRNNEQWEKAWDRYDKAGKYDMNASNNLDNNNYGIWQDCPECVST